MEVTGYCLRGRMANGENVREGSVAMNHVPFGTVVRVEGLGSFVVRDRIGWGSELDIWFRDCADAIRWGRREVPVSVSLPHASRGGARSPLPGVVAAPKPVPKGLAKAEGERWSSATVSPASSSPPQVPKSGSESHLVLLVLLVLWVIVLSPVMAMGTKFIYGKREG